MNNDHGTLSAFSFSIMEGLLFPDIIIYHAPCNDGYAAAAILRRLNKNAMMVPTRPGDALPSLPDGKRIIMVDVCVSVEQMDQLAATAAHVHVMDHHVTNADAYRGKAWPNVTLHFEVDTPGCWLAWRYVMGKTSPPDAIHFIGLRDVWKHERATDSLHFTTAFVPPATWREWEPYLEVPRAPIVDKLIAQGAAVVEYQRTLLRTMAEKAEYVTWNALRVAVINVPHPFTSEVGNLLCSCKEPTVAVMWSKQIAGPFNVSLRSNGPDVAKIAETFGGGGHAKAAGFRTETPPYEIFNGKKGGAH